MGPRHATAIGGGLLAALCLVACGEVIWIDPEVNYGDEELYVPHGDPAVELGFYSEQLYEPLTEGGECFVVHGLQGGMWTMPAVRITGIAQEAHIACTLTTAEGERVGITDEDVTFVLATDGWLEIQTYPIRVYRHPDAGAVEELFGEPGTLECSVVDSAGRGANTSMDIVFAQG